MTVSPTGQEPLVCGKDEVDDLDRCEVVVVDPERVRTVRQRLLSTREAEDVADVFKVLADPSRCRLVAALIEAGELCVCDLAATLGLTDSNVSHHLRVLRDRHLVRARRAGKMVFYAPDDEHIRLLLDLTRAHVRHGDPDGSGGSGGDGLMPAIPGTREDAARPRS